MGPAGALWGRPCPALPGPPLLLSATLGGLGPASFLAWPLFSSEPIPECRSGCGSPVCAGYWDGTQQIRQLMKSILEAEVPGRYRVSSGHLQVNACPSSHGELVWQKGGEALGSLSLGCTLMT